MSDSGDDAKPKRKRRRRAEAEIAPLGSLSQPLQVPAGTQTCHECRSPSLTRVPMTLDDGRAVTFVSCHDCEERAWVTMDGQYLRVADVLGDTEPK